MDKWSPVVLDEVVEFVSDKINVEHLSLANYVSTENMLPNKGGVIPADKLPLHGRVNKFVPGDILFSNIRTYFKKIWHASLSGGASPDLIVFRPKSCQKITDRYLYYLLSNDDFIDMTVKASKGTKMPRGDKDAMRGYQFLLPPILVQHRISDILSAYDELIENNQRRIRILEDMARSLYREWFMHFRYPGHASVPLVDTPLGLIPQGWKINRICDFGKVVTGKTPSKANPDFYGVDIPFVKTPDMHGNMFLLSTGESLSLRGASSQANKVIPSGSICVSCIGTIGVVSIATENCQTNQQINSIILEKEQFREFLFFSLQDAKQMLENLGSNGATMANVNKSKFESLEVITPSNDLLESYHQFSSVLFLEILVLTRKTANLRRTRDLLLPRLLSGQIAVPVTPAGVENELLSQE